MQALTPSADVGTGVAFGTIVSTDGAIDVSAFAG